MNIDLDTLLGNYKQYFNGKNVEFKEVTVHLTGLMQMNELLNKPEVTKRLIQSLRRYINLLDEFPDFRKEQLTKDDPNVGGDIEDYINRKYLELKGKSPE